MSGITTLESWAPRLRSILRITTAWMFLLHGSAKLLKVPKVEMFNKLDPFSVSMLSVAGWLELVGGLLLLFGLFSRPVAFLLSGLMAVAYFIAHASKGSPLMPLLNGGEPAALFCFIFLYLWAAGPGPWSLDALRGRSAGRRR